MKVWIVVGALDGKINEVNVFDREKEALIAEQSMRESYDFPEITKNDVALFEKEINEGG